MRGRVSREQLAFSFEEPTAQPYTLVCDDVLRWAETYTGPKFHALLTDAPYHLTSGNISVDWAAFPKAGPHGFKGPTQMTARAGFMNQQWDGTGADGQGIAFKPETWKALAQHLLPGAFIMAFGSSRGWHRLACAMEDAGLRIHPSLFLWSFGSGFPKSTRIPDERFNGHRYGMQAIKPASEPLVLAQKEFTTSSEHDRLAQDTTLLMEAFLCQFINAMVVEQNLHEHAHTLNAVLENSARSSVFLLQFVLSREDTSDMMAMWRLPEEVSTLLSIVSLWNNLLAVLSSPEKLSIIKTESAVITALRILNSWFVTNTPDTIIQVVCRQSGRRLPATDVDSFLNGSRSSQQNTQKPIAHAYAFESTNLNGVNGNASAAVKSLLSLEQSSRGHDVIALLHVITEQAHTATPSDEVLRSLAKSVESLITAIHSDLRVSNTTSAPSPVSGKAAISPIIVAQVPYTGKPLESIVKNGSGALNIDGARLSTKELTPRHNGVGPGHNGWKNSSGGYVEPHAGGRWPPNFALQHDPRCVAQGTRQVRGVAPRGKPSTGQEIPSNDGKVYGPFETYVAQDYADANGLETIQAWACHESCPVRKLDLQAGELGRAGRNSQSPRSGIIGFADGGKNYGDTGSASRFFHVSSWSIDVAERLAQADPAFYCAKASRGERSAGLPDGERNNHPCVKPLTLLIWLCKLLAPPAAYAPRRLLIPFAGSFSEACAAVISQQWESITAIEQDASSCEIGSARLKYWTAKTQETPPSSRDATPTTYDKKGTGKRDSISDVRQRNLDENLQDG